MIGRVRPISFALGLLMLGPLAAYAQQNDVESRAMRDEMQRSMKELHLDGTDGPYYVAYKIIDTDRKDAQASFGSLLGSGESRTRSLSVSVRVGDYQFDNSGGSVGGGPDLSGMLVSLGGGNQLPLDDNYDELRRKIWLATDAAYKRAVEQLSAKKAKLATNNNSGAIANFSKEPAHQEQEILPPIDMKLPEAEELVRAVSKVFRTVPSVQTSGAQLEVVNSTEHFLSSEGTTFVRQIPSLYFHAAAALQIPNGEQLSDSFVVYGRSLNDLPKEAALVQQGQVVADRLAARVHGKNAKHYIGPVLLEGDAAAEVFEHHFANALSTRQSGGGGGLNALVMELLTGSAPRQPAGLLNKIGSRVLPDFLSVVNNPQLTQAEGQPLLGNYKFDEEGTPSQETLLIQDGLLKTLLNSRSPARGIPNSTGSARNGGINPGNLLVNSTQSVSEDALKKQLLDLVKTRNLDYGVIVRSLAGDTALEATRIFPDGHEEEMRDARVNEIDTTSFRDILAVSSNRTVFTDRVGGNLTTFVVPDLLFEDMTIDRVGNNSLKRPELPNPLAGE